MREKSPPLHNLEGCKKIAEKEQEILKVLSDISVDLRLLKIMLTSDEINDIIKIENKFFYTS